MTYVPFDIMVIAYNGLGQSKEMATMVTGWSGEASKFDTMNKSWIGREEMGQDRIGWDGMS